MKLPPISRTLIILVAIGIGGLLLFKTLFAGNKSNTDDLVKQLLAQKDSVTSANNRVVVMYERLLEEKQRTFEILTDRDSVLNSHYAEAEAIYKKLNDNLKAIPLHIRSISSNNDSLRSEFARF